MECCDDDLLLLSLTEVFDSQKGGLHPENTIHSIEKKNIEAVQGHGGAPRSTAALVSNNVSIEEYTGISLKCALSFNV